MVEAPGWIWLLQIEPGVQVVSFVGLLARVDLIQPVDHVRQLDLCVARGQGNRGQVSVARDSGVSGWCRRKGRRA